MPPKKYEAVILYTVMFSSVLIFTLSPAYLSSKWDVALNHFMDNYLFGNGYYLPSNYPFAAKITNNFGTLFSILIAIILGFWRLQEQIKLKNLPSWKISLFILFLTTHTLISSFMHYEFQPLKPRNLMLSEAFHNNYFGFLFLMICKNTFMYCGIRFIFTMYMVHIKKSFKYIP